jgi:hypothetical protein
LPLTEHIWRDGVKIVNSDLHRDSLLNIISLNVVIRDMARSETKTWFSRISLFSCTYRNCYCWRWIPIIRSFWLRCVEWWSIQVSPARSANFAEQFVFLSTEGCHGRKFPTAPLMDCTQKKRLS